MNEYYRMSLTCVDEARNPRTLLQRTICTGFALLLAVNLFPAPSVKDGRLLVRLCSSSGGFITIDLGSDDAPPLPGKGAPACHAFCATERKRSLFELR